jgi:hypothetical protein
MEKHMYAASIALAGWNRRRDILLLSRIAIALLLALTVWFAMMVAAAAVGRLVLELGQWVGVLVLEVLGAGLRMSLPAGPHALGQLTSMWPSFHLGQLTHYAMGADGVDLLPRWLSLVGIAVLFCLFARRGLGKVR